MRIAFLSPSGELGGAERCLIDLVASLASAPGAPGMSVFTAAEGPLAQRLRAMGIEVRVVPMPASLARSGETALRLRGGVLARAAALGGAAWAAAGAARHVHDLRRALAAFRPDVVHSNGMKHHLLGVVAAPGGARVVWHVRDLVRERPVTVRLLRLTRRRACGAIAISRLVADDLAVAVPGLPVQIVHDAIDVEEFSPGPRDPDRLDALAGFAPGPALRVGLVATYARWKGHDVFLEAAREVPGRAAGLPIRFYVVGGPIYATADSQFTEAELRERAGRLGIARRVGFVPFQPDPAWLFRTLDVTVHASTRPEPFGRTIAEAMACGCPVVATRTSGAVERLVEGREVSLVPPREPSALARAIEALAGDALRRGTVAASGVRAAASAFGRARLGAEALAAYSLLGAA